MANFLTWCYDDYNGLVEPPNEWFANNCAMMMPGTSGAGIAGVWPQYVIAASPDSTTPSINEQSSSTSTKRKQSEPSPDDSRPAKRPRQRINTNLKERRRNVALNDAFQRLQSAIPSLPRDQKLPKIKTLRIAIRYIEYLRQVLAADMRLAQESTTSSVSPRDFSKVISEEVQTRNSYKQRAEMEMRLDGSSTTTADTSFKGNVKLEAPNLFD